MNPVTLPRLKIRRANSLDRAAWQEWMREFATLVRLEAHARLPLPPETPRTDSVTRLVATCDAVRVALVEYSPSDPESPPRVFIKPSAWSKISQSSVLAAVIAYRHGESRQAKGQKSTNLLVS